VEHHDFWIVAADGSLARPLKVVKETSDISRVGKELINSKCPTNIFLMPDKYLF
jgi:hypothetical protein